MLSVPLGVIVLPASEDAVIVNGPSVDDVTEIEWDACTLENV